MGAVAVAQAVHDAIVLHGPAEQIEFFHGYTYSAHPAACAAALAALDLYEQGKLFERARELAVVLQDLVFGLRDLPCVADIRGYGLLAALELRPKSGPPGLAGNEAQKRLLRAGLHIKATGDALLLAPAFVAERSDLGEMVAILRRVLSDPA